MPVPPAFERLRQEDHHNFEARFVCMSKTLLNTNITITIIIILSILSILFIPFQYINCTNSHFARRISNSCLDWVKKNIH